MKSSLKKSGITGDNPLTFTNTQLTRTFLKSEWQKADLINGEYYPKQVVEEEKTPKKRGNKNIST